MLDKDSVRRIVAKSWLSFVDDGEAKFLCDRLMGQKSWKDVEHIMLYYPLKDELDVLSLLDDKSKTFYFPRVDGDDLIVCKFDGFSDFKNASFGINEPFSDNVVDDLSILDLIVVPGVAFDCSRNRIGRGKGFYDRFLKKLEFFDCESVALCFDFQIFEKLAVEEHDVKMDYLICDKC